MATEQNPDFMNAARALIQSDSDKRVPGILLGVVDKILQQGGFDPAAVRPALLQETGAREKTFGDQAGSFLKTVGPAALTLLPLLGAGGITASAAGAAGGAVGGGGPDLGGFPDFKGRSGGGASSGTSQAGPSLDERIGGFLRGNRNLLGLGAGVLDFFGSRGERKSAEQFNQTRLDLLGQQLALAEQLFNEKAPLRQQGQAGVLDFLSRPNSVSEFVRR